MASVVLLRREDLCYLMTLQDQVLTCKKTIQLSLVVQHVGPSTLVVKCNSTKVWAVFAHHLKTLNRQKKSLFLRIALKLKWEQVMLVATKKLKFKCRKLTQITQLQRTLFLSNLTLILIVVYQTFLRFRLINLGRSKY